MFNPAALLRLLPPTPLQTGTGMLACLFPLVAQAAQPDPLGLCLAVTEIASSRTQATPGANRDFAHGLIFGKSPRWVPAVAETKLDTLWTTSIRWHVTDVGSHPTLSPRFRFESKESRIEIRPLQRIITLSWRKALP